MIKTVLFDLDGTIVDTNELIIETFLYTLEGLTDKPLTRDFIAVNMGKPLREQLHFFTGLEDVDHLIDKYRGYNVNRHDELVREFPGVSEVIGRLHANGIRLGVVTSKVRRTTDMGLKLCGLEKYMDVIVTVEDVERPKPAAEPVLKAIQALGADKESTLMVGDSHYDILSAQGAGVLSAGVAWSLKGEEFLNSFAPNYMLQEMQDLLSIAGIKDRV
ncbi:pyrophosphatase PpaX [Paenibacillus sp. y28]|uniref:pyrophosphatase PpaX n=1 Tax=Paenibacillus sp. y28 TaxID=3129110 RepID=UPI00301B2885